ncbi:MAG: SPASM domain-containing protein, partial [Bacteroidales bacterium]
VFVKKDWNIILSELVKNDLTPNYISTKVPITESIAEQLFKTGYNNVIQLSIDSLNPNILTKIIGSNKNYIKKMRAGIEILQRYGFKIQIDTILTKYNLKVEDILEMFEYIKSIKNLVYWEIRTPEKSIYNIKSFAEIKAKKGELLNIYHYIETNLIPNAPIRILTSKEPLNAEFYYGNNEIECFKEGACGALNNNCFVLPDGKVTLCEQLYWHPKFVIGDLKEQTIQQMWTSDKAKALLNVQSESNRKESACKTCNSFDFCSAKRRKCWAKIINAYGEKNWDFPDPRCEYAPVVHPDLIYN